MRTTNDLKTGDIVKLKFGASIKRADYRGRLVAIFSVGAFLNAEVIWFTSAREEFGPRSTFPADELCAE